MGMAGTKGKKLRSIRMDSELCPDHSPIEALSKIRNMPATCNFVLVVDDKKFPAYRAWLSSNASVFDKMLNNGMKDMNEREVVLRQFGPKIIRNALDFIYGNELGIVDTAHALELLQASMFFGLRDLDEEISKLLLADLTVQNCVELLTAPSSIANEFLKDGAMNS